MNRIFLLFALIVSFFPTFSGLVFASDCVGESENVSTCLSQQTAEMKRGWAIVLEDYQIDGGVREKTISIANRIILITSLISVGAIVFAGFFMVTAYGEEERIKKGKNSLRWGIGGLLVGLLSFAIVNAVVNLFYNIG